MADELAGPLAYGDVWVAVAIGLPVLLLAVLLRRRLQGVVAWWRARGGTLRARRAACLAAITDVERRHRDGQLTAGDLHGELSRLVRDFVRGSGDTRADSMTLRELEQAGTHDALLEAVREFYRGRFDPSHTGEVAESLASARTLVARWR